MERVLYGMPLPLIAITTFLGLAIAHTVGDWVGDRRRAVGASDKDDSSDGYVVSGVVGLLALLLSFTFGLAVDRFDARRIMVLQEANAIGTTYLRAQTFGEPYRAELSRLLTRYVDLRLEAAQSKDLPHIRQVLGETTTVQANLWSVAIAGIALQRDDVSSAFMESLNSTIDLSAARKASRLAHVPSRVFGVLLVYMLMTAGVLGYVVGAKRRVAVLILLLLTTLSYMLILDIDSPNRGGVKEGQVPMTDLKAFIAANPSSSFSYVAPKS